MRMLGRREQRINRALSRVLEKIEDKHNQALNVDRWLTWREIDEIEIERSAASIKAYDRAKRLHEIWQARIEREE
jgi:hypothetical protein